MVWKRSAVEVLVHTPIPEGYKEDELLLQLSRPGKKLELSGRGRKENAGVCVFKSAESGAGTERKVIGEQTLPPNTITASFEMPYQPGTLIARSYTDGRQTGADTLRTVGKPVAIRLRADRKTINANRNDLSYVACRGR